MAAPTLTVESAMQNEAAFLKVLPKIADQLREQMVKNEYGSFRWWYCQFTIVEHSAGRWMVRCKCKIPSGDLDKLSRVLGDSSATTCLPHTVQAAVKRAYTASVERAVALARSSAVNDAVILHKISKEEIDIIEDQREMMSIPEFLDDWTKEEAKAMGKLIKPLIK